VESPLFAKSARLKSLLLYLARKTLDGRLEEITESQIGVNVFGRAAGYNPAEDNIVRSHARLLRKKLEAYFAEANEREALTITIPKGAYLLNFEYREPAAIELPQLQPPEEEEPPIHDPAVRPNRMRFWLALAFAAIAASVVLIALLKTKNVPMRNSDRPSSHLLWSRIFQPNRNTLFVPADSGLVMFENFAHRPVRLSEYLSRQYIFDPIPSSSALGVAAIRALSVRRYTSFVDLNLVAALVRLPEVVPGRLRIRYTRDLSVQDFKESNVILSGAIESNPWLELLENRLLFKIEDDQTQAVYTISDACPAAGNPASYSYSPNNPKQSAYAVVAFLSDHASSANALVLEGTTVAGTEGATDFVLNERTISPIVQRATLADGSVGDFQVLLETRNIAGSAPAVSVIAEHYGSGACNANVTEAKWNKSR
jgi:hypothetical protein